jgi:hypothetical protein
LKRGKPALALLAWLRRKKAWKASSTLFKVQRQRLAGSAPVSLRILAPDLGQGFELIDTRDGQAGLAPGSDALFERGVVEQAFSFKTPFERVVLPAPGTQSVLEGQKQMTSTTHENI